MEELIELTIEKLAGLGDGVAQVNGRRFFVPYTLPGDVVRARVTRETKDASYAQIEEIITPAMGRIQPVCRHFSVCGGCAFQHMAEELYVDFKQQTAREAVRKAGFDPACVLPLVRILAASRRRVELKVADGRLGYYEERSHRLVDIWECKVLEPALEALVLRLKPHLILLGIDGVQINGVDNGYDVLLRGGDKFACMPGELEVEISEIRRISIVQGAKLRTLFQSGPVTVTLGKMKVEVPPGAFLQASREAQAVMTARVVAAVGQAKNIADLFAGIGTYSFCLERTVNVTAVEGDAEMVKAMQQAAALHGLNSRFKAERRNLFTHPLEHFEGYDVVIFNPPRAGALAQAEALARSKVDAVIMVSCNPATFARDARALKAGGFSLNKVLPIDQFVYTAHLEIIAEFSR